MVRETAALIKGSRFAVVEGAGSFARRRETRRRGGNDGRAREASDPLTRGVAPPKLGERLTLAAPHCDPTVNLYEAYHVVRGDTLEAIWPVSARGRSA